jgi:hypothetical protein
VEGTILVKPQFASEAAAQEEFTVSLISNGVKTASLPKWQPLNTILTGTVLYLYCITTMVKKGIY